MSTSSYAGKIQAFLYGCDMDRMLQGLLVELIFGNMGVEIPTYVRIDDSDASYRVDSVNTVTNGKRLNGLLASNIEESGRYSWLGVGYIPGDINTSDGQTKSLSSANLRNTLETIFPEYRRKKEIN